MTNNKIFPRIILKTSYQRYLSKRQSLNLMLDNDKNNGADWHFINHYYTNMPNQIMPLYSDKYNLGKKGILKRTLHIYYQPEIYYIASYARAMFEILHDFETVRTNDINELMFEKSVLRELKSYFKLHNCNLCKQYLLKENQWN